MSKENEEIKSQIFTQNEIEQAKKDNSVKFTQEKVKVKKPKTKTWVKVFWAIIITLIIGIIGGGIGLYMLQEKTDFWFIVPSSLTRKTDDVRKNNENKPAENNTENNTTNQTNNEENKLLTMDEAYKKLDELYKMSAEVYMNYPSSIFTVNKDSHPTKSASAVELPEYDKEINKYFTKSEKADYEETSGGALIEENDKVYVEAANGTLGLDYLDKVFTKIEISENEVKCEVINLYNGSLDNMKVTSEGVIT